MTFHFLFFLHNFAFMKRNLFLAAWIALTIGVSACGNKPAQEANPPAPGTTIMQKLGPEFTAAYICPMYCEGSGSDKLGKCPVCGMDYRENKDAKKEQPAPTAEDSAH
jgi:hypothetical protein